MDFFSIIIIALGLAMDCFAVSLTKGLTCNKVYWHKILLMASLFGFFQACMPLIGYFAGLSFADTISSINHWIAFGLLSFVGVKMIWEGRKPLNAETTNTSFSFPLLFSLAFATSIDALATGIIFVPFPKLILTAILVFGIVAFLFSLIGALVGIYFGRKIRINMEIVGGFILIGIGVKILLEKLFF